MTEDGLKTQEELLEELTLLADQIHKTLGLSDSGSDAGSVSSDGSRRGSSPTLGAVILPLAAEVAALGSRLDGVRDSLDSLRRAADNVAEGRKQLDDTHAYLGSVNKVSRNTLGSNEISLDISFCLIFW